MRYWFRRAILLTLPLVTLLILGNFGCEQLDFRSQTPEEERAERDKIVEKSLTELQTKLLGDYITVTGLNMITLEGVGLVVNLNGTGGDPPPSTYRTTLLEQMRKMGVPNPNALLADRNTALVVVRAYLPPLIREGDQFDVEVRLPGGSEATSLRGGWLLPTELSEHAIVPGTGVLKGKILARATGPVLVTAPDSQDAALAGNLLRGKIIGGAKSLKERDMALYLKSDYRHVRMAKRISDRIGQRFYHYNDAGSRKPLAEAKTDQMIELKIHPRYRDNFPRYLQVIRHIAGAETAVTRRVRMQRLRDELYAPETSYKAALQLEAIGNEGIPLLKSALRRNNFEVKFNAALALAYLGDISGLDVLVQAAREEPAFRVYALAAIAAADDGDATIKLRELLHVPSEETRYGAFRTLMMLRDNHPTIAGEHLNQEYMLHVVESDGPPLVHITHYKRSEVVVFGRDLEFRTPLSLRAGNHILINAPEGSETITVSRYEVGQGDMRREVSLKVDDVIRTVAEFGGSYPDITQMLVQAAAQDNLPCKLGIDSMPQAGRYYTRDGRNNSARIGSRNDVPNIFQTDVRNEETTSEEPPAEAGETPPSETASAESAAEETPSEPPSEEDLKQQEKERKAREKQREEVQEQREKTAEKREARRNGPAWYRFWEWGNTPPEEDQPSAF